MSARASGMVASTSRIPPAHSATYASQGAPLASARRHSPGSARKVASFRTRAAGAANRGSHSTSRTNWCRQPGSGEENRSQVRVGAPAAGNRIDFADGREATTPASRPPSAKEGKPGTGVSGEGPPKRALASGHQMKAVDYGQLFEPWTVFGAASPSMAEVTFVHCALPLMVFPASWTRVESLIVTEPPTMFDSISTLFEFVTVSEPVNVFPGQSGTGPAWTTSPGSPMSTGMKVPVTPLTVSDSSVEPQTVGTNPGPWPEIVVPPVTVARRGRCPFRQT